MSSFSRYFLSSPVGQKGFLDLRLETGELSVGAQSATVVGTAQVDWVFAGQGTSVDFTGSGAGVDVLYLQGNLADYTLSLASGVLTLTRTVGTLTSTYKINASEDKVVFANGAALAADLAANASAPASVTLDTAQTSSALPSLDEASTAASRVRMSEGGVLSVAAGPQLLVSGTSGVESVFIRAGGQADLTALGGGTDKIYLNGKWADYSKTTSAGALTFTRTVGGVSEKVVVSASSGGGNDQLYFADGNIRSLAALSAVSTRAGVTLAAAGGVIDSSASSKSPVTLATASVVDISADAGSSESDFLTNQATQTITGSFTGQLAAGDKVQVRLGTGAWSDAVVSGTTSAGGAFSLSNVTLAEGGNQVQVRVLSANGQSKAGAGKAVTLDTGVPEGALTIAAAQNEYVNSTEAHITLRVTDMSKLKVGDRVRLQLGGESIEGVAEIQITEQHKAGGVTIEVPKARLSEGAGNRFTLVATDVAGNTSTSAELAITLDTEVPTPVLSVSDVASDASAITGLAADAYLNAAESAVLVKVALSQTDTAQSVKAADFLQLKVAGANLGSRHTVTAEDVTRGYVLFTVNKTDLGASAADGQYALQVVASDVAGNQSQADLTLTLDTVAPAAVLSLSDTQADGTAFEAGTDNNETLTLAESTFVLKLEGDAAVTGGGFKVGDVVTLQRQDVGATDWANIHKRDAGGVETTERYTATVQSNGGQLYLEVTITDLPAGLSQLRVTTVDLAGNTAHSGSVQVNRVVNFFFELPETEITALDVDGQLVISANSLAGTPSDLVAVSGSKIRLVHTSDATRTQEIDVTDTRFVTIIGNRVIIKPPFDLDFGGAYRVEVDANAFTATVAGIALTKSRAMVQADALGFGTVDLEGASDVANAAQGQVVQDDGTVASGKKWLNAAGQGDAGAPADWDLSGGDYAVVIKDTGTNGGRVDQGDGVQVDGVNLKLRNVGDNDRIYVDDTKNDKAALNNRDFTSIKDNGSGGLKITFEESQTASNGNQIDIVSKDSGASLDLGDPGTVRGLLNVSNTRLGTRITAIERVGSDAAQDFGGDLAGGATFDVKISANLRAGDKVQLVRLDASGNELNWGAQVTAGEQDIANGHITLSRGSLTDLVQGRNTVYAKITGVDGAVTKGAMLFDAKGGFDYDTTAPEPVLSVATAEDDLTGEVSEDATLTDTETSVSIKVEGWTVGDRLQLKLGAANLGSEITITEGMLNGNGELYVSVAKADLGGAGAKQITASITDRAGNVGTAAAALAVEVLEYVQLSGAIVAGPVLAGNDLVVTAYDTAGNVIGQDETVQAGAGTYSLNILKTYTGPVLIKVSSKSAEPDYMDEGTGRGMDLGANTFFAVTTVSGTSVSAHVTPLTDVAAKKLMTGQQLSAAVGTGDVQEANEVVAKLFLGQEGRDVTSLQPTATINTDGTGNAGGANLYGQVLEQISKQAVGGKTFADVQSELVTGLSWGKGQAAGEAAISAGSAAGKAQIMAKLHFNVNNTTGTKLDITKSDLVLMGMTDVNGMQEADIKNLLDYLKNAQDTSVIGDINKIQEIVKAGGVSIAPKSADTAVNIGGGLVYTFQAADFPFSDSQDANPDGLLNVIITKLPVLGTLKLNGVALRANQVVSKTQIDGGLLVYEAPSYSLSQSKLEIQFKVQDDALSKNGVGLDTSNEHGMSLKIIPSELTVSGLLNSSTNELSTANGVYKLLSLVELQELTAFSNDFSPSGNTVVDLNRPVYSMTSGNSTWYVWARAGSGYHISQASSTQEWYWEGSSTNFATTPELVTATGNQWQFTSGSAADVISGAITSTPQTQVIIGYSFLTTSLQGSVVNAEEQRYAVDIEIQNISVSTTTGQIKVEWVDGTTVLATKFVTQENGAWLNSTSFSASDFSGGLWPSVNKKFTIRVVQSDAGVERAISLMALTMDAGYSLSATRYALTTHAVSNAFSTVDVEMTLLGYADGKPIFSTRSSNSFANSDATRFGTSSTTSNALIAYNSTDGSHELVTHDHNSNTTSITDSSASFLGLTDRYIVFSTSEARRYANASGQTFGTPTVLMQGFILYDLQTKNHRLITHDSNADQTSISSGDNGLTFVSATDDHLVFRTTRARYFSNAEGVTFGTSTVNQSALIVYDIKTGTHRLVTHTQHSDQNQINDQSFTHVLSTNKYIVFQTQAGRFYADQNGVVFGSTTTNNEAFILYDLETGHHQLINHNSLADQTSIRSATQGIKVLAGTDSYIIFSTTAARSFADELGTTFAPVGSDQAGFIAYNVKTGHHQLITHNNLSDQTTLTADLTAVFHGVTQTHVIFETAAARIYANSSGTVFGATGSNNKALILYDLKTGEHKLVTHNNASDSTSITDQTAIFHYANDQFVVFETTAARYYANSAGQSFGLSTTNQRALIKYDIATGTHSLITHNHLADQLSITNLDARFIGANDDYIFFTSTQGRYFDSNGVQFGPTTVNRQAIIAYDVKTGHQRLINHVNTELSDPLNIDLVNGHTTDDNPLNYISLGGFEYVSYAQAALNLDLSGVRRLATSEAGLGVVAFNQVIGVSGSQATASTATGGSGLQVTVSSDSLAVMPNKTAKISFTFNEAVTDFTLADISIRGGVLSNLVTTDNMTFSATFTANSYAAFSSPMSRDGTWFYFTSKDAALKIGNTDSDRIFADNNTTVSDVVGVRLKTLDLVTESDDGANRFDNTTSLKSVTINAFAKANTEVSLYSLFNDGLSFVGKLTTNRSGYANFAVTNLNSGDHQFYLTETANDRPISFIQGQSDYLNLKVL